MKSIIDFLEDPKKTKIYEVLNVSDEELVILQRMVESYLDEIEDVKVRSLLSFIFGEEKIELLKKVKYIKNLIDEGWLVLSVFGDVKSHNVTSLELFNSSVSLSVTFLKLLEEGNLDIIVPEKTPYEEHLEYLHDEFLRIEIYEQIANFYHNNSNHKETANIKRLQSKLKLIENTIKDRIKLTLIDLPVRNFIIEKELSEEEEILFLALLKEEFIGNNEKIRDLNYLLNLISHDEIERIKNRTLLDDNSKLISEGIFDYDEVFGMLGNGYTKIFMLNEEILNEFAHPRIKKKTESIVKETIFEIIEPEQGLDEIVLPKKTRDMLDILLKQIDKRVLKLLKEWGIKKSSDVEAKIIFYGAPGTGKTITAYAIAKELKKPILSLDSSKILSMYVGESEKNVRKMFDDYYHISEKLKTKPILLLNEADQFFSVRTTGAISSADKMHNQMQNIFLEQLEKFDGVLIATTNLLENIDAAFSRRFEYKIEFTKPNYKDRKKIWEIKLPKNAPYEENFDVSKLAKYDLTGAQIEVIIKNTAYKVARRKKPLFKVEDFIEEIKKEKENSFDAEKEVGF